LIYSAIAGSSDPAMDFGPLRTAGGALSGE
jgi:hypothetical protein